MALSKPDTKTHGTRKAKCRRCGIDMIIQRVFIEGKEHFATIEVACDTCEPHLVLEGRIEDFRRKRVELIDYGLLSRDILDATFKTSTPECERDNAVLWRSLRHDKKTVADICEPGGYFFYGAPGTGKSFAARCLLNRIMWFGQSAAESSARRILKTMSSFQYQANNLVPKWKSVKLLLIDDIDKANLSGRDALPSLWELLDVRRSRNATTIMTSNYSPTQLHVMMREQADNPSLADATLERLRPCVYLEFKGRSLRVDKAK